jgi:hypothetical protein
MLKALLLLIHMELIFKVVKKIKIKTQPKTQTVFS